MKKQGKLFVSRKDNLLLKFTVTGAIVILLVFLLNVFNTQTKNIFYSLSFPLQKNFWSAGISSSNFLSSILSAPSLNAKNEDLKNQNQQLLSELAYLKSMQSESMAQSNVEASTQGQGFKLALAGVVGLDTDDVISINKGLDDGIAEGMPVINQQNNLVGKVLRVYKNFSQVMLITNKNSVVNVKIQSTDSNNVNEIDGVIKGSGQMSLYLDLIPIDDKINYGDILVTSSIDNSFPKDILVGTISKIEHNDQEPHQKAQVSPFFSTLQDNVFVITNFKQVR